MRRTLGELKPGESGYIATVGSEDPRVKRRLVDMGITPMTRIFVRKTAPMGDPIEVHLRGYDYHCVEPTLCILPYMKLMSLKTL